MWSIYKVYTWRDEDNYCSNNIGYNTTLLLKSLTSAETLRLYKPVSDWLEMLPLDSTGITLNMKEYFLLDINEMKRNDLWLNVKGIYMLFVGKILLNLYWNNEALIWLKFKTMQFHGFLVVFWRIPNNQKK